MNETNLNLEAIEEKKFNRNKWFFAASGIGRDMVYALVANYFFMYVQFGLTLSVAQFATLSILIGVLGRIWDGINDPLMGTIIDGAHFKMGKFKPWILMGSIFTGLLLLALFNIRPFGTDEIYGWIYVGIMVVVYLLWEAAFTMNDIGYWGAIPSLSKDKKKRDSLTSLVIFFAGVGSGAVTLCVGTFSPGNILTAYTLYSVVASLAIIASQTMVVLTVEESPREEEKEEKSSLKNTFKVIFNNKQLLWLSSGYLIYDVASGILGALIYNLYYLEYGYDGQLGIVIIAMGVIQMILQALYPKITKNLTRKQIQKYSLILMGVGYSWIAILGWTSILPFNPITLSLGFLLTGVGGTYFYIVSLINMTNCVEYNEYLTGERKEAIISSVRPLIVKFSTAIKSLLTTLILILSGLYILSQDISNLETQRNLFNDKVENVEDMKVYVSMINKYSKMLEGVDKDTQNYEDLINQINDEINSASNDVLKRTQVNPEYLEVYSKMYILKYSENTLIDQAEINKLDSSNLESFFSSDYKYVASFVFSYEENGETIDVNLGTQIYKESDTLLTKIILRIMVTIVPVSIACVSYYIQNKKFIVNEEYYDMMVEELKRRKEQASINE